MFLLVFTIEIKTFPELFLKKMCKRVFVQIAGAPNSILLFMHEVIFGEYFFRNIYTSM